MKPISHRVPRTARAGFLGCSLAAALCGCVGVLAVYLALAARRNPGPDNTARAPGAESVTG